VLEIITTEQPSISQLSEDPRDACNIFYNITLNVLTSLTKIRSVNLLLQSGTQPLDSILFFLCFRYCCLFGLVYIPSKTLFQLLVIFSPLVQNTALHLAAIHDTPEVVSCLLSYPEQEILMNNKNHNVLDAALNSDRKNVSLAIASHERLVKENHSFNSGIQRSARGISRALHVINTHKLDLYMKIIVNYSLSFVQSVYHKLKLSRVRQLHIGEPSILRLIDALS